MGITRRDAVLGTAFGGLLLPSTLRAQPVQRPQELRIGITTFLSGPASVFGVPGRQAAEMLIDEINRGGGIGGVPIRPYFVDEGPGVEHLLGEFRRLVLNERVEVMLASISSGSCLACTPLAEELRRVTLLWDCGTQRIFEEKRYQYAFRTQANATPEVLAPLLYLLKRKPDFRTIAVLNQDYAWGRDSWELWRAGMQALKPDARVVAELFPRFGATDFSTEVTRLLALRPDVILSTSWGGELDTFIRQAAERRLFERSTFVMPLAESSLERVGRSLPAGHIVGSRGDHWFQHPAPADKARLDRFVNNYRQRFNSYPIYPTYHMYQALSALQAAYAKAMAGNGGNWPNEQQLAAAFPGLEFDSPTARMTIREDGQGLEPQLIGTSRHTDALPFATLSDMIVFPPELVTAPVGRNSVEWLRGLSRDILDRVPAPAG
ncbi:ABC transporter substrate-binding protein [Sabulicella rubraurantiaca]|uniref:ABC transporter substrate-binding protein n=1 Tax=Sabulicella rubraurantiaca TaxID=2811429 RepID=UPI001A96576E|nr:ABC transporter substrate-binding protein [Sabulicella rubraurantiaca]